MASKFDTKIAYAERSRRLKEIQKKNDRGPYSKNERIRQAIDIKTKQIIESTRKKGGDMTDSKARDIARQIAEHRDKRFD